MATLYRDQNGNQIQVKGSFDDYPQGPTSPNGEGQLFGDENLLDETVEVGKQIVDKAADQIVKRAAGRMRRQFLRAHNEARAQAGMPALSWDRNVSRYARRYAQQRKADCEMIHSNGGPYGENIFWGAGSGWNPGDVVTLWAGEQQNYDAKSNACAPGKMCGHYTQVVWKNSQKLGCARVVCNSGDVFMTCNYDPPGNYQGISPFS